ncbi:MAG: HAD-IC family P-type ATPase [Planctomycetes bacterium]|nr:HAD-IC family P-type ATPase [Planctomycetota bacterium]
MSSADGGSSDALALSAPERPWHTLGAEEAVRKLKTDPEAGLSGKQARRRLNQHGPNHLRQARRVPWWQVLGRQLKSLVAFLLVAAAIVAFSMGEALEGCSIIVVLLLNVIIGFFTEYRAGRAMEALQKLGGRNAVAVRDGRPETISATDVVPGDILLLQEGDYVPADGRLVEVAGLQVDESSLTGESLPVAKRIAPLEDPDTALADRACMVFKGTHVTTGNARVAVTATGMKTEIGRVSALVTATEDMETPLERRLAEMGRRLIALCLAVALVVVLAGIAQGQRIGLMIEVGIALAIAAVPEGLPVVATVALAVGMRRMARRNALVRRLAAVETLGSVTCVCTDKTGTLTRNEMTVARIVLPGREIEVWGSGYEPDGRFVENGAQAHPRADLHLRALLVAASLCNNANLRKSEDGRWEVTGDPTEAALIVAAEKAGIDTAALRREHRELQEFAFSSDIMLMGTVNAGLDALLRPGAGRALAVKGAPDRVLRHCRRMLTAGGVRPMEAADRAAALDANHALAADGRRVLGVAFRPVEEPPAGEAEAYRDLIWAGLMGLEDPTRDEVRQTVDVLTEAGVKTVMITGDQAPTAARVAAALHIAPDGSPVLSGRDLQRLSEEELAERLREVEVLARVSPEQKVDILRALQRRGEICAMLGDGVNDAVALKGADIGVAMGIKGADVAKETADMILLDDRFVTIGHAVEQGRIIYANIKKFIHYLFSCNLSEVCTMLGASLLGRPLPLLPLQILWLNMITDVLPALALAMEPGEEGIMKRPPRPPDAALLGRRATGSILGYGLLITVATMAAFLYGRFAHGVVESGPDPAITMSFLTIGFAQIFHVFNSRKEGRALRGAEWWSNPFVLGAIGLTVALQLAAVYLPGLNAALRTARPAPMDWLVIGTCSLMPLVVGQAIRRAFPRMKDEG